MTSYRIPNYLRASWLIFPLDDGTSPRVLMPTPGGVNANVAPYAACRWPAVPARIDLEFLFRECRNPARGLSADDYATAAAELGVDVPAIQAVAEVETSGEAFDESGRPRILFERHYFHRRTDGRYAATHPRISNARAGGYGKFSAQYGKLEEAYRLAPEAALRAASWGRFQIMGDNFKAAGFASVEAFVLAMTRSEAEHLMAFTRFVKNNKRMLAALRKHDWAAFAAAYNGPGYRKNSYDTKLEAAHRRFSSEAEKAKAAKPAQPGSGKSLP